LLAESNGNQLIAGIYSSVGDTRPPRIVHLQYSRLGLPLPQRVTTNRQTVTFQELESSGRPQGRTWHDFMNPSLQTTADLPSGKNLTAETGVASVVTVLRGDEDAGHGRHGLKKGCFCFWVWF
jgi:hypothetical protein